LTSGILLVNRCFILSTHLGCHPRSSSNSFGQTLKIMKPPIIICFLLMLLIANQTNAQQTPYFSFNKGSGLIAPDSSFSLNTRFRIQNRFGFITESEDDFDIREVEARVRRLRLRFDGFAYLPNLTYLIQLSFSRGDLDYETMKFPNVIRDAYVQYAFSKCFSLGMGQTKLPGNRQRIISSGEQQMVDRSIVNATFNIDRDFGLFANYKTELVSVRGAISSGEGRNINSSNAGLAYTVRLELTPFGAFKSNGEYSEGDLAREQKPKLALAMTYHRNESATRTSGQTGYWLAEQRNIQMLEADLVWKFNGWAYSAEYMERHVSNPYVLDETGATRYMVVGNGHNHQFSRLFKNNFEIVGRYSRVSPGKKIAGTEKQREQYAIGFNKYLRGHRVKLQSDITLESWNNLTAGTEGKFWNYRFQIEVGI
jgi:phosphate-selective porin OprO and OprP